MADSKAVAVAQHLRMSTEHQLYSLKTNAPRFRSTPIFQELLKAGPMQ
jgi:hypothetical protein